MNDIIGDILMWIWIGGTIFAGIVIVIDIIIEKRKDTTSKLPINKIPSSRNDK